MKNKKINFQITVGYKAVITFNVKAENEEEAREIVTDKLDQKGIYEGNVEVEDYKISGIVNNDTSWNMII